MIQSEADTVQLPSAAGGEGGLLAKTLSGR